METLLYILGKIKFFIAGFFAGLVLHHFEMKIGNGKFNFGKFVWAGTIFGLLTVFGNWVITGWFAEGNAPEEKTLVLSLMVAVVVQFIIPFALRNPEKFAVYALDRIGLQFKNDQTKTHEKTAEKTEEIPK